MSNEKHTLISEDDVKIFLQTIVIQFNDAILNGKKQRSINVDEVRGLTYAMKWLYINGFLRPWHTPYYTVQDLPELEDATKRDE